MGDGSSAVASGDESVEDFYSSGSPDDSSANTGLEESNVSQLFFYEGPDGPSFVTIHDEPDTRTGGDAKLDFDTLPNAGSWVVEDDSSHASNSFGRERATWSWGDCCTDGGAYRGGFEDGYTSTIDATFESGIDT